MNKKFLRKVLEVILWLTIIYIGVLILLLLSLNAFVTSFLVIAYIAFVVALKGWIIPKCIIANAKRKLNQRFKKDYASYKLAFKEVQKLHEQRYKLYFSSGDLDKINILTNAINKNGKIIIVTGNNYIAKADRLSKKQKELIQDIIDETTLLMENESVNSNVTKSSS